MVPIMYAIPVLSWMVRPVSAYEDILTMPGAEIPRLRGIPGSTSPWSWC